MNYKHLQYFSVLASLEHYTLAAARLDITQPSLSSAIRQLEEELGVRLFEKVGRNIRLTEQGRYFQKKVEKALEELQTASQTLRSSQKEAPVLIRVGFISGSLRDILSRQIARYLRQDKRAYFRLTEDSSEGLLELLRQERLDMALVSKIDRDRSLHFQKLVELDFCVAMPEHHALSRREQLDIRELKNYPQIAFDYDMDRSFETWANQGGEDNGVICQVNTIQAALELVSSGIGIAIVPELDAVYREGLAYVPLKNVHQALYLCTLYDKWLEPAVWDFSQQLVELVKSSG